MKTSIPSAAQSSQPAKQSSPAHSLTPQSGPLAQIAAMMNQSPQVQAQLKLSGEMQNGEPVQRQMALASGINQSPTAQPRLAEEEAPAQGEASPNRPHEEARHIVQQKPGRVKPTMQMKGGLVNQDIPGDRADGMGPGTAQKGGTRSSRSGAVSQPIQATFTHKKNSYDKNSKKLPAIFKVSPVDLKKLADDEKIDFGVIETKEQADAALVRLREAMAGAGEQKGVHAEKAKKLEPYLEFMKHLAGEVVEEKRLTGGHLLSAMKEKFPNLKISGAPDQNGLWEGWWTDGANTPKWSSFFPASWTREHLEKQLEKSGEVRGGRELPGGIVLTKMGGTFFPWVEQTLKDRPEIEDMFDPPE